MIASHPPQIKIKRHQNAWEYSRERKQRLGRFILLLGTSLFRWEFQP